MSSESSRNQASPPGSPTDDTLNAGSGAPRNAAPPLGAKRPEASGLVRYFPMLPFLPYLRPHRWRIVLSIICLVFVGILEPFNIVLLKPGFDVILGAEKTKNIYAAGDTSASASGNSTETKVKNKISDFGPIKKIRERLKLYWRDHFQTYQDRFETLGRENPFAALIFIGGIIVIATILKGAFEYASNYILTWVMRRVSIQLQTDILRRVMLQDFLFFKQKTTGYLISRIGSDVQLISNMTINVIRDGLQQPLTLIFLSCALVYLSPEMSVLALMVLPIGGIILYRFSKRLRKITKKSRKETDEQSSMLEEALRNYHIVKAFATEEQEVKRFTEQSEVIFQLNMKGRRIRFGTGPLMEALGALAMSGILIVGGYLVLISKTLSVSNFIVYLVALINFYAPIKRLPRLNVRFSEATVSSDRMQEMLSLKPGLTSPKRLDSPPPDFKESIRLEDVSFGYDEEPVLEEINLTIPKGKMVALVGETGSGKTTMLGLLPRLYDPDKGRVLLDGKDLREFEPGGLRRLYGIVTQETVLFNDSVLQNITYGSAVVDRKKAEACAKAANAHDFIMEMPRGYDTTIGQSGSRLSGGQCQRLAIARALYRDPPVLLLDEATSHLDTRTEALVQEAIDRLLEGRTSVVIAHRLSTIQRADMIVVLKNGRIIEKGSHEELINHLNDYKKLYSLQSDSQKAK